MIPLLLLPIDIMSVPTKVLIKKQIIYMAAAYNI